MKYIDLFCGIGSFHQSFHKQGWECVMACDINKAARDTYASNHHLNPLQDITDIDPSTVPNFDILCAGFPCQPFSQAGKQNGFEDDRGNMFFHTLKFIAHHQPRFVVLENVPALFTHDAGNTFARISRELSDHGYTTIHKVLKCSDYGIPQMRKRLFLVGVRNDIATPEFENILDTERFKSTTTLSQFFGKNFDKDTAYTIRCGGRLSPINDRHNWDGYLVDGLEHRLTLEEALQLQGFPADFQLEGGQTDKWKLLGNTIPTVFTHIIAENIKRYSQN